VCRAAQEPLTIRDVCRLSVRAGPVGVCARSAAVKAALTAYSDPCRRLIPFAVSFTCSTDCAPRSPGMRLSSQGVLLQTRMEFHLHRDSMADGSSMARKRRLCTGEGSKSDDQEARRKPIEAKTRTGKTTEVSQKTAAEEPKKGN